MRFLAHQNRVNPARMVRESIPINISQNLTLRGSDPRRRSLRDWLRSRGGWHAKALDQRAGHAHQVDTRSLGGEGRRRAGCQLDGKAFLRTYPTPLSAAFRACLSEFDPRVKHGCRGRCCRLRHGSCEEPLRSRTRGPVLSLRG